MDIVLSVCDTLLFDRAYAAVLPCPGANSLSTFNSTTPKPLPPLDVVSEYFGFLPDPAAVHGSILGREDVRRQFTSLFLMTWSLGFTLYATFATLSYIFMFDKSLTRHPKFLMHQVYMEIKTSLLSMPLMALLTAPFFLAEVQGYSQLYLTSTEKTPHIAVQVILFLLWSDFGVYWIHRGLHHPVVYKYIHKPHHKWIVPSPFASIAFHPVDGWMQSLPYHLFPFLFPMHKLLYLGFFTAVQLWTVCIHDNFFVVDSAVVNGTACHTIHHLYFNYNYGQFFTLWDRLGGSYRRPGTNMMHGEWKGKDAIKETERMVKEIEGGESREYVDQAGKKRQ
ncbi:putative sterol delta 5,6-desaturase [Geopyxis carbonaria]|nr:putative sterol delta 5,6-desaturase [Geopyxis carbonaria]